MKNDKSMFSCEICGAHPMDGLATYRVSGDGLDGASVFRCISHLDTPGEVAALASEGVTDKTAEALHVVANDMEIATMQMQLRKAERELAEERLLRELLIFGVADLRMTATTADGNRTEVTCSVSDDLLFAVDEGGRMWEEVAGQLVGKIKSILAGRVPGKRRRNDGV